mgnify:CR=1 FL=1
MKEEKTLDLSWSTIFKIAVFLFFVYLIYLIKEILVFTLFAFVISFLIEPIITVLEKKLPRIISVLIVYFFIFFFVGYLIFFLVSPIFSESQKFIKSIPDYFERISPTLRTLGLLTYENFEDLLRRFQDWVIRASKSIFSAIFVIFGGIFSTLTIFSLAIFISLEKGIGERLIRFFSPQEKEEQFLSIFRKSQAKISAWFWSKLLSCFIIFLLTLVSLKIFKVEYAFLLSLIAGFLNLVPIIGPTIAGILIFILALLSSFQKAIFSILAFILIQLIEGNIILPILTQKFVGLSPFLTLLSLLIGGKILGFWGALFSIPLMAIIIETTKELFKQKI